MQKKIILMILFSFVLCFFVNPSFNESSIEFYCRLILFLFPGSLCEKVEREDIKRLYEMYRFFYDIFFYIFPLFLCVFKRYLNRFIRSFLYALGNEIFCSPVRCVVFFFKFLSPEMFEFLLRPRRIVIPFFG